MSDATTHDAGDFRRGLWRLADPKISLTSAASMYLGVAVAAIEAGLHWGWLGVTALGFFAMEVAKNAWGDVIDYDSGADQAVAPEDRTEFSGGKRVLVDDLLTRAQTWGIAAGFTGVGLLAGLAIVLWREPAALWIGMLGLILGWSYHGPPLKLAYRGLGELDVVICYGPLIALATHLIQTHRLSLEVLWLSLPLGLLIAAFLWINEFPDVEADRRAGKRNLVVRLGRRRASRALALIYLAAFALTALLPWLGLPAGAGLGLLALVPAAVASRAVWRDPAGFHRHSPAQPAALAAFLVYSLGAGSGVLWL
jgi:1,4-dihydroxy-2-naphthoate octaprenyltransferase